MHCGYLTRASQEDLLDHPDHSTTVLRSLFRDHPCEPVPEENSWTLWCKGRSTEADTPTIRLGATPSGLTSAHVLDQTLKSVKIPDGCIKFRLIFGLASSHNNAKMQLIVTAVIQITLSFLPRGSTKVKNTKDKYTAKLAATLGWFTAGGAIRIALWQVLQNRRNRKLRHLWRHNLGSRWKLQKWLERILVFVHSTI